MAQKVKQLNEFGKQVYQNKDQAGISQFEKDFAALQSEINALSTTTPETLTERQVIQASLSRNQRVKESAKQSFEQDSELKVKALNKLAELQTQAKNEADYPRAYRF